MKKSTLIILTAASISLCAFVWLKPANELQKEVQTYLDAYNKKYKELSAISNEADWKSNTMIIEGDSSNALATRKAREAFADFSGSEKTIEQTKNYLAQRDKLTEIQVKQLEKILYISANNPASAGDLVKKRIKAEAEQVEKLFGYEFNVAGKPVTANDIDRMLTEDISLEKRELVWNASKEVGKNLRSGLVSLRDLRNQTVRRLGYPDYFTYQVSDYGMERKEMMDLLLNLNKELYPLYRELHTFARYELAKKYNQKEVPDMIPAHWLPNRWGQDWSSLVDVKGINLDSSLNKQNAEWIVKQAEQFYVSLGMPALPPVFYKKSDLYPLPAKSTFKKNNHASAWHMDYDKDVRSLMSVEPNAEWYETTHHELGHIYYYMLYSTPDVPVVLREGANRAYHEALGSLMGLAAMQKPFLEKRKLIPSGTKNDNINALLKEALHYVVFIPWSAGVMSHYENSLYAENLPEDHLNKHWWDLVKKFQGIVPPSERSEEFCDAATKTHINDDPAQYYDYALSYVLLFQLHDHIANNILKQDPHATNYYGSKETGKFIASIMEKGATGNWRETLMEKTGEELSAKAMLRYFEPLMAHLQEVNKGRKYTLPE